MFLFLPPAQQEIVMKRDIKSLQKASKELFAYIQSEKVFDFSAPEYPGISQSGFNDLTQDHLDALQTAVLMWETREKNGDVLTSSDFCSLVTGEYENLMPEIHQKRDKPGKKHDKKSHDNDHDDDFDQRKSFRR